MLWCLSRLAIVEAMDRGLSTTQVAKLFGVSRQHVADLADRGELPSWRVGRHRRFDRGTIMCRLPPRSDRVAAMNLTDRRSLAYCLLLSARLVSDPEAVLAKARENLEVMRAALDDGSSDRWLDRWAQLLDGPLEATLHVLTALDEESTELRHMAPFAGLLTDEERLQIIDATRRAA
jgi:excisionase family DNA binding protein